MHTFYDYTDGQKSAQIVDTDYNSPIRGQQFVVTANLAIQFKGLMNQPLTLCSTIGMTNNEVPLFVIE